MSISIEKQGSCSVIVKGEFSADEIETKMAELIKKYSKQIRVPGFRPGKVPKSIILSRYGDAFKDEIRQEFLSETVKESIEKMPELEKAIYMDEPKMDKIEDNKPFVIEIYAELKPQFDLVKYDGFEVERNEVPVKDEEIDAAIEDILVRNTSLEERSRPAQKGDYVEVKFFEGDNEPIPMIISLDDPEYLNFFDTLVGKSAGDKVEIEADFPDNFPDRRLQGKSGKFAFEITKVLEQVKPELNSEFFTKMGKPDGYTEQDFRKEVAEYIRQQKTTNADNEIREKIIEELVKANPIDIPKKYLDARVKKYISEQWDISKIEQDELIKLSAEIESIIKKQIAYEFIAEKIAEVEKIEVSDDEVLDFARNLIVSMGYSPDLAEKIYKTGSEEFERLRDRIKRDKALDIVISRSKITVKPFEEKTVSDSSEKNEDEQKSENTENNE